MTLKGSDYFDITELKMTVAGPTFSIWLHYFIPILQFIYFSAPQDVYSYNFGYHNFNTVYKTTCTWSVYNIFNCGYSSSLNHTYLFDLGMSITWCVLCCRLLLDPSFVVIPSCVYCINMLSDRSRLPIFKISTQHTYTESA